MERRDFLKTVGLAAGASLLNLSPVAAYAQGGSRPRRLARAEPIARNGHATALLPGGLVLVIGGLTNLGSLASCQVYDPDTDQWFDAAPLASARGYHSATTLPGQNVLVLGGYNNGPLTVASMYDPIRDTWERLKPLNVPRYRHTAQALHDGRVVVTGGLNNGPIAAAEVYEI